MIKIIDSKIYDTDHAEALHDWQNRVGVTDFSHCEETLYVTKNKNYFLHGKGGPNSKYSVQIDSNSYGGGEAITPLSLRGAIQWLEKHNGEDVLLKEFAEYLGEA